MVDEVSTMSGVSPDHSGLQIEGNNRDWGELLEQSSDEEIRSSIETGRIDRDAKQHGPRPTPGGTPWGKGHLMKEQGVRHPRWAPQPGSPVQEINLLHLAGKKSARVLSACISGIELAGNPDTLQWDACTASAACQTLPGVQ